MPKNVILNKLGRSVMNKIRKKKDDKWRPPGKLNRKRIYSCYKLCFHF